MDILLVAAGLPGRGRRTAAGAAARETGGARRPVAAHREDGPGRTRVPFAGPATAHRGPDPDSARRVPGGAR
ncbi:hypothetical protein [Streptomyces sp. NPDC001068]|uniref:hypothetical protein n=1 Tax=Streptomyces sp. NPDC001068 TaxID=3364544 RepID=UPI0036890450